MAPRRRHQSPDVTAVAVSSSSTRVTFTARVSDNSYSIERAEGSGSFAAVASINAPGTATTVAYVDQSLKPSTPYQYRVVAVANGCRRRRRRTRASTTLSANATGVADITTDITANRTLYADTTYTLKGFIHVTNGATLTIQPGTKIQGDFNTLGSSLFIMRGAKIQAVGTADAPIVFTSSRAGRLAPARRLGRLDHRRQRAEQPLRQRRASRARAPTARRRRRQELPVCTPAATTPTDNSGTLSYVRVEFAGYAPAADNEFNAFTFAAVGSGTRISYLESLAGLDDAFEFFGGALDGDHLVAYETGDDMFDMSRRILGSPAVSDRLQLGAAHAAHRRAGRSSTDLEGIENDGCNGSGCDNRLQLSSRSRFRSSRTSRSSAAVTNGCVRRDRRHGMMLRRGTRRLLRQRRRSRASPTAAHLDARSRDTYRARRQRLDARHGDVGSRLEEHLFHGSE